MLHYFLGRMAGEKIERLVMNAASCLVLVSLFTSTLAPLSVLAQAAEGEDAAAVEASSEGDAFLVETSAESAETAQGKSSASEGEEAAQASGEGEDAASADEAEVVAEEEAAPETEEAETSTAESPESTEGGEQDTATTSEAVSKNAQSDETIETTSTSTASESASSTESGTDGEDTEDGEAGATASSSQASSAGGGNASIETGNANGIANILNITNTGIFNSTGALLFLSNLFGNYTGLFDLRQFFDNVFQHPGRHATSTSSCSFSACDSEGVDVAISASSTARIVNDIVVRAMTGGNTAIAPDGSASIETGDAYAAANVVNVANTNITNSNYLLVSMTNFGDLSGDIVLPGKSFFEKLFFSGDRASMAPGSVHVDNNNDASVGNDLDLVADSGNNTASSTDGNATVETGNAETHGDVVNEINKNFFNTNALVLLFRVYGDWDGNVLGAPDGVRWRETASGVELWHDPGTASSSLTASTSQGRGSCCAGGSTDVQNDNNALIDNNVSVLALTGDNRAEGDSASITTGNAYAAANILNIANTNIFGTNFIFAIFDIFGNWSGNIAFGRPDLWIGGRIETSQSKVQKGDRANYHFTIANRGDADAHGVRLRTRFPSRLLHFGDAMESETSASWDIGTVPAGEIVEVTYGADVGTVPAGETLIETNATVESDETDGNMEDNTETIGVVGYSPSESLGGAHITYTPDPDLRISKTNSAYGTLKASSSVDYTISIENVGKGPAYHSTLTDVLKGQDGSVINEEQWTLGTIAAGEEITVTYRVEFSEATKPGTYTNSAQVKAIGRHTSLNPFYGSVADSEVAMSAVQMGPSTSSGQATTTQTGSEALMSIATTTVGVGGMGEVETATSTTTITGTSTTPSEAASVSLAMAEDTSASTVHSGNAAASVQVVEEHKTAAQSESLPAGPDMTAASTNTPAVTKEEGDNPAFLQSAMAALAGSSPFWIAGAIVFFLLAGLVVRRIRWA
jgi:hypothetical protein